MLSIRSRPLLYFTLPGVAFIMGVFWLRRRNKVRCGDMGKDENKEDVKDTTTPNNNHKQTNGSCKTNSLNINGSVDPQKNKTENDKQNTTKDNNDVDKNNQLRSIDERFDEIGSCDLPGSLNESFNIKRVYTTENHQVVVRATTSPKISPENSFVERPLEESTNNNSNQNSNNLTKVEEKRKNEVTSPSLSMCSVQSSTDSGKGSSLPRSDEKNNTKNTSNVQKPQFSTYEFFLPTSLIGRLYGNRRNFLNKIKARTSVKILMKKHPYTEKINVCVIEGSDNDINTALKMIRYKLPSKQYPNLTMQRIHFAMPQTIVPLTNEHSMGLKLNLIEGINNDVVVSAVISGGHIFVQQPLHPSHPSLVRLQKCLCDNYNSIDTPMLPEIADDGICVCNVNSNWYRVQIVQKDPQDTDRCLVKFLDYGGYMNVGLNDLRQIRSDYMAMPFQATECILSNIVPNEESWSPKSGEVLYNLTRGVVLQAQVAGYNSDNTPEIYLYASIGPNNIVFINKELVARNLAKWVETED
ncbi:AKAP1 family protein [Megaselia abdita]